MGAVMATYWEDDTPLPPIPWDTLIRWGAMLLAWALAVVTACCLGRLWLWLWLEGWR